MDQKTSGQSEATLSDLLLALRRQLIDSTKDHHFKSELTGSQLEVLWLVGSAGSINMEGIATYLGIKPPSVTAMIDKMER